MVTAGQKANMIEALKKGAADFIQKPFDMDVIVNTIESYGRVRMYNYKLQIQYDGGRYDGWQRMGKDSSSNTIEAKIKEIISKMTGEDIDIYMWAVERRKACMRWRRPLTLS